MNYIFDFDGVLANTFDRYVETLQTFLLMSKESAQQKVIEHSYTNRHKTGMSNMMRSLVKRYQKFVIPHTSLLFQARVDEIHHIHGKKAILSRNDATFIREALGKYRDLFDSILGFDEAPTKVQGILDLKKSAGWEKSEVVFFTDTIGDIKEVKEVLDVQHIYACDWGFNSREILLGEIPAGQIISDFKQFL
jgi:phosphoglycolate phosphatase-like HAD superfamily hydrolase